jgi:citrate/tricarballylate utilization protein
MQLVDQAKRFSASETEAQRVLTVCNACRYCEGFCAAFQGMTRRLDFNKTDIHYLANLCHSCGACLHACQYAPPHEFAINVPRTMAAVRAQTYSDYAWPTPLARLYKRNGLTLALAVSIGLTLFLALAVSRQGQLISTASLTTNFYSIFPHGLMVSLFAPIFGFASFATAMGIRQFWRQVTPSQPGVTTLDSTEQRGAQKEAVSAALRLRYLDGGHGEGCNNEDDRFTHARRHCHHATFYGFMLCFAATSVATVFHYGFGWQAPYGYASLPKLLGISGGVLLSLGTAGLWLLNRKRHPLHTEPSNQAMDKGFVALLFATATTGLALMLAKNSTAMPALLCVHLGVVMGLFLTMPYSKFAHGFYRLAALIKFFIEKRQKVAGLAE